MNKFFFALGLGPAFALGACGGTADNTATTTTMDNMASTDTLDMGNTADNAMMTGMAASPAQQFADTMAASDQYEIEAGKLAQDKATAQGLKDFGKMMVTDHTKSTDMLKDAGAKANPPITPNPVLNAEQEANLAALRAATGADFDTAYKAQQVAAHEKALAGLKDYAANGEVPELKQFATDTAKVVQTHLDKIKAM